MAKKEIITKIQKCVELTIPFAAAICAVWGLDIAAYATAIGTAIIYVLEAVKVCIREKQMERTKCEVFSRSMGFIRPIDNFNIGKRAEFEERKLFKEAKCIK